jgi:hypothetical protein
VQEELALDAPLPTILELPGPDASLAEVYPCAPPPPTADAP